MPRRPDRPLKLARTTRRVAVIGAGFIGARVARTLTGHGDEVVVLSRSLPVLGALPASAVVVHGDAGDPLALGRVLRDVDAVVYCAGGLMPAAANAAPHEDLTLALSPLLALLDALRAQPEVELIFLSSGGTVYGAPRANPVAEDHPTDPISAYGVSKLAAEKYIGMHMTVYGLRARILRCANIYGPGQPADRQQGAVAVFLDRALRSRPLPVFGDGSAVRDYLHVDDLGQIVADLIAMPGGPAVLNVGSGTGATVLDLVDAIAAVIGYELPIDWQEARPQDVDGIVLDIGMLRKMVTVPVTTLVQGIADTHAALVGRPAVSVA